MYHKSLKTEGNTLVLSVKYIRYTLYNTLEMILHQKPEVAICKLYYRNLQCIQVLT